MVAVNNVLRFRTGDKLEPKEAGVGGGSVSEYRFVIANANGNGLDHLKVKHLGFILLHGPLCGVQIGSEKHGIFACNHRSKGSGMAANPDGILRRNGPSIL